MPRKKKENPVNEEFPIMHEPGSHGGIFDNTPDRNNLTPIDATEQHIEETEQTIEQYQEFINRSWKFIDSVLSDIVEF